jgi:hypothetical protein
VSFSPRDRDGVKESLHRFLSEAPSPLMWPLLIVASDPRIEIGLQFVDGPIDFTPEGDAIELVQHGSMEALDDAVGLRAFGFRAGCGRYPRRRVTSERVDWVRSKIFFAAASFCVA